MSIAPMGPVPARPFNLGTAAADDMTARLADDDADPPSGFRLTAHRNPTPARTDATGTSPPDAPVITGRSEDTDPDAPDQPELTARSAVG